MVSLSKGTLPDDVYVSMNYQALFPSHKAIVDLLKEMSIRQIIVDEEGDIFIYYRDTNYGPVHVMMKRQENE